MPNVPDAYNNESIAHACTNGRRLQAVNSTVNMYAYVGMYGIIGPWRSHVAGSLVRAAAVATR
jgi:hypothetical protein